MDILFFFLTKPILEIDITRTFIFTDLQEGFLANIIVAGYVSFLFIACLAIYTLCNAFRSGCFVYELKNRPTAVGLIIIHWFVFMFVYWNVGQIWSFFLAFEFQVGCVSILLEQRILPYLFLIIQLYFFFILGICCFILFDRFHPSRAISFIFGLSFIALITTPEFQLPLFGVFVILFESRSFWRLMSRP